MVKSLMPDIFFAAGGHFFSTTIVPALLVSMSTRSANREELIGLAAGHRSVCAPRRACPRLSVARPTAQCSWPKPNGSNPLCLLWSPQWQQCVQWCYTFGSAAQWTKPWNCEKSRIVWPKTSSPRFPTNILLANGILSHFILVSKCANGKSHWIHRFPSDHQS